MSGFSETSTNSMEMPQPAFQRIKDMQKTKNQMSVWFSSMKKQDQFLTDIFADSVNPIFYMVA